MEKRPPGVLQRDCRRCRIAPTFYVHLCRPLTRDDKGAIFATLGLTALQIPGMDVAWWTARACCVASMIVGVLSVITATRQHLHVVMLKSPLHVRLWLSSGRPSKRARFHGHGSLLPQWEEVAAPDKYAGLPGIEALPLESSVASLKAVTLPGHLLDLSVLLFIAGIGLYELSGWQDLVIDVETGEKRQDGRSIPQCFHCFRHYVGGLSVVLVLHCDCGAG